MPDAASQDLLSAKKDAGPSADGATSSGPGFDASAWTCTDVLSSLKSSDLFNGATVDPGGALTLTMKAAKDLTTLPYAQMSVRPIVAGERFRISGTAVATAPTIAGAYVYDASCSLVQMGWRWVPSRLEDQGSPPSFSVHGFNYVSEVKQFNVRGQLGAFAGVLMLATSGAKPLSFASTIGSTDTVLDAVADATSSQLPPAVVCGTSYFAGPGAVTVTFSGVKFCTQKAP